ncbi:MAG: FAD-dependent oxidoreductase [Planctomycetota bacterium]
MTTRIAVIGAGIAGATAARALADAGHAVTVFEKARGPGGRMASRRTARDECAPSFDHGCQMLSLDADITPAEHWTHRLASISGTTIASIAERTRPVPTPRMNTPIAALLEGINATYAARISRIETEAHAVTLHADDKDLGTFDRLIITAPAPQSHELLQSCAPTIAEHAAAVTYDPNWTLMLNRPAEAEPLQFDAAEITAHPVAWLCHDNAKPQRQFSRDPIGHQRWIAQFAADFSRNTIDQDPEAIAPRLLAAAQEHLGDQATLAQKPHRWRCAFVTKPVGRAYIEEGPIIAAGDWLLGNRAHHAANSGHAAAIAIINR